MNAVDELQINTDATGSNNPTWARFHSSKSVAVLGF